jgi:hypothetical protein
MHARHLTLESSNESASSCTESTSLLQSATEDRSTRPYIQLILFNPFTEMRKRMNQLAVTVTKIQGKVYMKGLPMRFVKFYT